MSELGPNAQVDLILKLVPGEISESVGELRDFSVLRVKEYFDTGEIEGTPLTAHVKSRHGNPQDLKDQKMEVVWFMNHFLTYCEIQDGMMGYAAKEIMYNCMKEEFKRKQKIRKQRKIEKPHKMKQCRAKTNPMPISVAKM